MSRRLVSQTRVATWWSTAQHSVKLTRRFRTKHFASNMQFAHVVRTAVSTLRHKTKFAVKLLLIEFHPAIPVPKNQRTVAPHK